MYKRTLTIIMLLSFMVYAYAQSVDKIEAYIQLLQGKLTTARRANDAKKVQQLTKMIEEQRVRLENTRSGGSSVPSTVTSDQVADLKEDMNKALADLKNQVDKVKKDNGDAKVGGLIFFRWQKYVANGGTHVNNFDVDRAYLDFKKKLSGGASARVTLDVARLDTSKLDTSKKSQLLFDYLKYAYVEMPLNISALQLIPWNLTAKLGLQHTVWIDWADKILGQRFIAKSIVDNQGIMSSSDFGVGALGKVSLAGLPDIQYHATLLNGSGYKASESNSQKDIGMRLNSTVYEDKTLGKVMLGVFGNVQGIDTNLSLDGAKKQIGMLAALNNQDLGVIYGEYIYGTGISALSLGGKYQFLPGYYVFARMDNYDPNRSQSNDEVKKQFYGLTYDWSKDVKLAADIQSSQTGSGATTSIFYLHSQITI